MENLNSASCKRSRFAYIIQCSLDYFVAISVSDVYLATLLTYLGLSNAVTGIIASFISLAFLFQLGSIFVVQKIKNVKRFCIFFSTLSQLLFMCLYLIPFLHLDTGMNTILAIVFILLGYFSNYFCISILFKWANSYVAPEKRGVYSAIKEIVSLVSGMMFMFGVGMQVDKLKAGGDETGVFIFIAVSILIISILNFIILMFIKNKSNDSASDDFIPLREVIKNTLGNKAFLNVIIMTSMLSVAQYMTYGFLGTFKTQELLLTVGTVQIINIVSSIVRCIISTPIGRFSDKYSYTTGIKLGILMVGVAYLSVIFTSPESWWLIIVFSIFYNASSAGTNQNSFNIIYSYVDTKYFVQAMAIKNSIGGILGFLASLLGGSILHLVQKNGNMIFGFHIYGQQVLAAISFVLTVILYRFTKNVVEKQAVVRR